MGRYRPKSPDKPKQVQLHPIWRGIGCLTLVGLLTGGFLAAAWFIPANFEQGWIFIPAVLNGPSQSPWLYAKLIFAILFAALGFAALTLIYGLVNPIKPGEFDAPPEKRTRR